MATLSLSRKLAILSDAAKYDASCASSGGTKRDSRATGGIGSITGSGICHSYAPDGRCISLLKILLTNFCVYDCVYCVNRSSSNVPARPLLGRRGRAAHARFLQAQLHRRACSCPRALSARPTTRWRSWSGSRESLRQEYRFGGYVHLKVIPNAAPELLAEAGRWADRLSTNIELPTDLSLEALAPEKRPSEIRTAMAKVRTQLARCAARTARPKSKAEARSRRPGNRRR